jgi:hypothetical protein
MEQQQPTTKKVVKKLLSTRQSNLSATAEKLCEPHASGSRHHRNPNRNNSMPSPIKITHDRKHQKPIAESHHDKRETPPPF